jgi:hypothetical protein
MAKVKTVLNKLKKMNIELTSKHGGTVQSFTAGSYEFSVHGREDEDALFDQRLNGDSVLYRNPTMTIFINYVEEAQNE